VPKNLSDEYHRLRFSDEGAPRLHIRTNLETDWRFKLATDSHPNSAAESGRSRDEERQCVKSRPFKTQRIWAPVVGKTFIAELGNAGTFSTLL